MGGIVRMLAEGLDIQQDVWVRHERLGCVLNLPIMWADMDPNLEKLETGGAWRKVMEQGHDEILWSASG
ncbi:hypothetical protein AK812_SmicGene23182 [Symbiodinium microadriaticum]|uniref:Uncharacterized protein n=1 Tax=Symbiodinium microadriaticum TaxID=2951 RepID=A0A1Q9DHV8_SYMMI|nr:hypothetical protein AK812_SmicGene23182 [Symbiodinium microadriaticum]